MKEPQSHIFFLNYSDKLPRAYIHLASRLAVYGVKLVPVSAKDLTALASPNKQFILSIIPDMASQANDLAQVKRVDGYDHLRLPIPIEHLARHLALAVLTEEFDTKSWPGGKRAKLPTA